MRREQVGRKAVEFKVNRAGGGEGRRRAECGSEGMTANEGRWAVRKRSDAGILLARSLALTLSCVRLLGKSRSLTWVSGRLPPSCSSKGSPRIDSDGAAGPASRVSPIGRRPRPSPSFLALYCPSLLRHHHRSHEAPACRRPASLAPCLYVLSLFHLTRPPNRARLPRGVGGEGEEPQQSDQTRPAGNPGLEDAAGSSRWSDCGVRSSPFMSLRLISLARTGAGPREIR